MSIAAVIGAGSAGTEIACRLAERNRFHEVRLIDPSADSATGRALDIQQAGAIVPFATRVSASADPSHAIGARVAVLADHLEAADSDHMERTLTALRWLARRDSTLSFVLPSPGDLPIVELAVRDSTVAWTQIVGSAPTALASGMRALVALRLEASPDAVSLTLLGVPPTDLVVPWSRVTIAGEAIHHRLPPHDLRRLEQRLQHLWPPGSYSSASAAAQVAEAMVFGSARLYCCSVSQAGEFGALDRALIMPVRLGPPGGVRPKIPTLLATERTRVERALDRTA